jgi:hypothetical protein
MNISDEIFHEGGVLQNIIMYSTLKDAQTDANKE